MENDQQLVLSLMELTKLPIDEAKRYLSEAGNILEVAIQNYYDAQQSEDLPSQQFSTPCTTPYDEDEVRAPLPREYSQLVEDESIRSVQLNRVKRQFSSGFRDLKKETEIQEDLARGIAPKRKKCLEDIYRNPIDITFNLDLYSAKHFGQKQGKWIALLINDESFVSLSFNRDIFNSDSRQKVKQLIKKYFIFLRKNADCDESVKIMHNYKLVDQMIPMFLIIDSLTGELRKNFGDTRSLTLKSVVKELKKYSSNSDKELIYNSDVEDSEGDEEIPIINFSASSSSNSTLKTSTANFKHSSQTLHKLSGGNCSDSEESFQSLDSDDVHISDEEAPEASTNLKESKAASAAVNK